MTNTGTTADVPTIAQMLDTMRKLTPPPTAVTDIIVSRVGAKMIDPKDLLGDAIFRGLPLHVADSLGEAHAIADELARNGRKPGIYWEDER